MKVLGLILWLNCIFKDINTAKCISYNVYTNIWINHYNLYDNLYFEQIEHKCDVSRYLIEIVHLPFSYNYTWKISWWSQWRSNLNLNQRRLHRLTSPGLRNIVQEPYKILYLMKVNNKSFIKCHVFNNLLHLHCTLLRIRIKVL